jgi:hypothetical protein
MRMVGGLLVVSGVVMFASFCVVLSSICGVFCCLFVMFRSFLGHGVFPLLVWLPVGRPNSPGNNETHVSAKRSFIMWRWWTLLALLCLFGEIVRERTFYQLDRRLAAAIKAALVEFVRALARIGRGTGKTAWMHRWTAHDAMERCYGAVPCWIMPNWRVAEQLPAELGAVDLVIIDEASQSDVTELPALLRGKKILLVGDDRQVSPTAHYEPE